jgi:hypothetical protein
MIIAFVGVFFNKPSSKFVGENSNKGIKEIFLKNIVKYLHNGEAENHSE